LNIVSEFAMQVGSAGLQATITSTQGATDWHWKGHKVMHGIARLRLVGTLPIEGIEECSVDDAPKSLPFPTCFRELPVGGRRRSSDDVLAALERVTISFERMRRELDDPSGQDGRPQGPRAA
jgi:hypothetical protein